MAVRCPSRRRRIERAARRESLAPNAPGPRRSQPDRVYARGGGSSGGVARAAGARTTSGMMAERTGSDRVALGAGGTMIAGAHADIGWQVPGPNGRSQGGRGCRSELAGACEVAAMSMPRMSLGIRTRAWLSICLTQATPLAAKANWLHRSRTSQAACRRRRIIEAKIAREVMRPLWRCCRTQAYRRRRPAPLDPVVYNNV